MGPEPLGGSCEGGKVSTHYEAPKLVEMAGGQGGSSGAMKESTATRVQRESGEIPAQRIGADQHSPAREACLLTHRDGLGLGAEARALEFRSQGEDWAWLLEHSLKSATVAQLGGREPGEKSGPA